ncbi:oxysterol-binding protein-related protein 6 isoform X1 [Oncorhynchus mykiss]|uniref:oxysterol-binding protein-related protein 6 isoform X1 n=1 Tax=Oncorhynchus mykiss TaxID=8022 RepID=UPI001877F4F4|nr:oxysterol-binding protein-related protein 6 isoform X1 [Oncorhynchus mykiss]XP_036815290.1 oxysterol-binding protein-related protein 6 isoform X1 [Oncorhynchus mykiss]
MSHHHHRNSQGSHRTMSAEERSSTPIRHHKTPTHKSASSSSSSQRDGRQEADSWEIIEGLKIGQSNVQRPDKHEGFMLKKRKWPLKGWHKRFFVLDNGMLKYSKSPIDIQKGKLHGCIDVGLSVMSIKKRARRIDLDTEEHLYHLKIKSPDIFDSWVVKLRYHRLYRQNEIVRSPRDATMRTFPPPASTESPIPHPHPAPSPAAGQHEVKQTKPTSLPPWQSPPAPRSRTSPPTWQSPPAPSSSTSLPPWQSPPAPSSSTSLPPWQSPPAPSSSTSLPPWQSPQAPSTRSSLPASYSNGQSKVAAWLQESEEMDKCTEELARCQSSLIELSKLLQSLEGLQRTQSAPNFTDMQVPSLPVSASMSPTRLHSSNPNLCAEQVDFQTPVSRQIPDNMECGGDYIKLQEDFCLIAQKVHSMLKSAFNTVAMEKEKIKSVLSDQEQSERSAQVITLRKSLSQALSQNAELKTRLGRIHSESVLSEQTISVNLITSPDEEGEQRGIPLTQQTSNESRLSMSESVSEFFDAQEVLLSASSSENEASDDESYVSDVSDNISEDNASVTDNVSRQMPNGDLAGSAFRNGRRPCLPAPSPDCSNINLWNILRNNIGKDLSKVSMPVELNEPLNTLQHMCEELEYTELLDRAADTEDPYERMAIMAAFVISGYSSTYYRAGSKPFNPLLGETYECIREDKGMCFIAEQVSHHPPISACHADSNKFTFLQDVRWKNKFWGKSMEILPIGTVNVILPSFGDHYEWNKVTTCVHNILSGRRWIEHYGEITVRNTKSSACICKLTFVKGNYWSSNVNEVQGFVMDQEGKVVRRLFGKWHEGLYCGVPPSARCIWRPGSMPTDYELYYGFTRFAIELNELCPEMQDLLPPTDARFRPDQRHLEEGNVEMAASEKQRIEDMQRTRRKWQDENDIKHEPRFFKKVVDANQRERWVTNNTYWELRKSPGFINMENPNLW